MNKPLIIILKVCFLLSVSCTAVEEKPVEEKLVEEKSLEDSLILSLVLKRSYEEGGYTVVAPQTSFGSPTINDPKRVEQSKKYILENIKIEECELTKLVDLLFERNKIPVRLSLKSSPKDGYIIDYDGKYKKYFEKDGGSWEKWYEENPKANGWTHVSLPAYDSKTNIILVYIGTQSHGEAGSGWVIAYKYKNGELEALMNVMMWIS